MTDEQAIYAKSTAARDATAQRSGLTPGQLEVLRQIVVNPNFRREFSANSLRAASTSGIKISATELAKLERLTPAHMEQFSHGVGELMKASDGCTHTLLYAIIVAVLLAAVDRNERTLEAF